MVSTQRSVLENARKAFKAKKYSEALENYDYFFDHALDDDTAAFYGVRLSYCLDEWARLGEVYSEARISLEKKRDNALNLLKETREPERFHDYIAICKYLECSDLPITQFVQLHESDRDLAENVVRFIWDQLVEKELWYVCKNYIGNSIEQYEHCVTKFDQAMDVCKTNESFGDASFESQIKGLFVRDVSNILLVLKNCDEEIRCNEILKLAGRDLKSRGYSELQGEINQRLTL